MFFFYENESFIEIEATNCSFCFSNKNTFLADKSKQFCEINSGFVLLELDVWSDRRVKYWVIMTWYILLEWICIIVIS